jgi:hypothetical protein
MSKNNAKYSDLTASDLNKKIKEEEISPLQPSEEEEYQNLRNRIISLPYTVLLDGFTDQLGLPDNFEGKKYTFAGYVKISANFSLGNGQSRAVPIQKLFMAHLIEPPRYPHIENNPYVPHNENFNYWHQQRSTQSDYKKFWDTYLREGIQEIVSNNPQKLVFMISELPKQLMGYNDYLPLKI